MTAEEYAQYVRDTAARIVASVTPEQIARVSSLLYPTPIGDQSIQRRGSAA